MHWRFHGGSFAVYIGKTGARTFTLEAAWHQPLPWMGGPNPEMDIEQVDALHSRRMVVRLNEGGPEENWKHARALDQLTSGRKIEKSDYLPRCVISTTPESPAVVEVSAALEPTQFGSISKALLAYASAPDPKSYWGTLGGMFVVGSDLTGLSNRGVNEFLIGRCVAMLDEAPSLSFEFGAPVREEPSVSSLMNELSDRI